jgi:formylglycine-generating enzyme
MTTADMTWVPGSTSMSGFWIDRFPLTNELLAAFVAETDYMTAAERPPTKGIDAGSFVFRPTPGPVGLEDPLRWWRWTPGACWRCPEGPGSTIEGREDHPVVHLAYEDAQRYASWAGKALPTEAEWELAAGGGEERSAFPWGADPEAGLANCWRGDFPWRPEPGYGRTTPVGSFPPNPLDLFDMTGNVFEWTSDLVSKGGSFVRALGTIPRRIGCCTSDLGLRCVIRSG